MMKFTSYLVLYIVIFDSSPNVNGKFYAGRIKPGQFEYPKHNGWMTPLQAKKLCEFDLACGGFTFKGSYKSENLTMEVYFFHFVPSQTTMKPKERSPFLHFHPNSNLNVDSVTKEKLKRSQINSNQYLYWSTFEVERNYTVLSGTRILNPNHSSTINISHSMNIGDSFEMTTWNKYGIVGFDSASKRHFSSIDFADFKKSTKIDHKVIINLTLKTNVFHTLPKINQCCVFNNKSLKYDGLNNLKRINCNISQEDFVRNYINKREMVMLTGCQDHWKAKNWTVHNLLHRYASEWTTVYNVANKENCKSGDLNGRRIYELIKKGYFVRVFHQLWKSQKGWQKNEKKYKLDLIDDYTYPKPFPKDMFDDLYSDSDQAYIMLATAETGTPLHVDPMYTDAFNALLTGKKWWVSLPKDLYEFATELTCLESCSETADFRNGVKLWYSHMLPQLRERVFYGQKIKTFLQESGETLYMPHFVSHAVWNIETSIALGENPLYESSFVEISGSKLENDQGFWISDRVDAFSKGEIRERILRVQEHIEENVVNIRNYSKPIILNNDKEKKCDRHREEGLFVESGHFVT